MRVLLLAIAASLSFGQQIDGLQPLVRDALRFLDRSQDRSRNYGCKWRTERRNFDSSGTVTEWESSAGERIWIDGVLITRTTEKNGRKLPEDELRKNDDILRTSVAELRSLPPAERERRMKKSAGDQEWLKEIPEALDFHYVASEKWNGRETIVLDCFPRNGYSARNVRARVFARTRGRLWIDKADRELVKADAEVFDTVNIGFGILGRVEKGTQFHLTRMRLPDGAWVMQRQNMRFAARMMLVKWIGSELRTEFQDYRENPEVARR